MAVDNIARALAAKALGNSAGSVTPEDLEKKYDKTGGAITGDVAIQGNLTVSGTTTTEKEKQLLVEDNVIVTNANKIDLKTLLSGLAINKNENAVYGIMYDPTDDTVKFGEGTLDENNKFTFKTGEGLPIAIREDSTKFTDAHLVKWDATKKCFVDAGVGVQTGPTGPTGPRGATGPTGPTGPAGERGPTGQTGAVGPTGPTGPAGLTTKVTVNGTTYTQSGGNITLPNYAKIGTETIDKTLSKIEYISESAIPSPPDEAYEYAVTDLIGYGDLDANLQEQIDHMGNTGPTGPTGATGPTGPTGAIGAVGPTGPTGAAGAKGDKGEQGAAGTNGKDGAVGPTGPKGDAGDIGPTGPTGPTGAAGAKGEQGAKGETGAQGPVGPTGPGGPVVSMTQSAYDALETKDANTLYVIVG